MVESGALFFFRVLDEHYAASGKRLSARVKELLSLSPVDFKQEDREDYRCLIGPARELVKESLRRELKKASGERQAWVTNCLSCSQTVIGGLVAEVLLEEFATQRAIPGLVTLPELEIGSELQEHEAREEAGPGQLSLEQEMEARGAEEAEAPGSAEDAASAPVAGEGEEHLPQDLEQDLEARGAEEAFVAEEAHFSPLRDTASVPPSGERDEPPASAGDGEGAEEEEGAVRDEGAPGGVGEGPPVGEGLPAEPVAVKAGGGEARDGAGKRRSPLRRALRAAEWAATLAVALLVLLAAFLMVAPRFGLELHPVLSGSMEPTLKVGGLVFCRSVPVADVREGDIIGFNSPQGDKVTHRVISVKEENGRLWFQTKGDANEDPDPDLVSINGEWVDRVVYHLPYLGYLSSFMRTRLAFLLLICGPAAVLVFLFGRDIWVAVADMRRKSAGAGTEGLDE